VDTSKAGGAALSVTVDGPSKVHLDCTELQTGYQFSYCPSVAGLYTVSVKYAGDTHISGSPFLVSVKGLFVSVCLVPTCLISTVLTSCSCQYE